MISQTEVFTRVLSELNEAGIDYMIAGSLAASAHGYVRDTHDMDLVVILSKESVRALADRLGDDFYFDLEGAEEAVDNADMFNVIHYETSVKIDFWSLKNDEYSRTQFDRRRTDNTWGISTFVETPEDTILSKLLWNQMSPSDRQIGDIRGILRTSGASLDYDYLRQWAVRLGVWDTLNRLIEEN
ncbi:MAG: hypothetical protein M1335_05520 [Chloroflexi bacterium]|nr:hypothetical protein [Chloroflexota bacterium]